MRRTAGAFVAAVALPVAVSLAAGLAAAASPVPPGSATVHAAAVLAPGVRVVGNSASDKAARAHGYEFWKIPVQRGDTVTVHYELDGPCFELLAVGTTDAHTGPFAGTLDEQGSQELFDSGVAQYAMTSAGDAVAQVGSCSLDQGPYAWSYSDDHGAHMTVPSSVSFGLHGVLDVVVRDASGAPVTSNQFTVTAYALYRAKRSAPPLFHPVGSAHPLRGTAAVHVELPAQFKGRQSLTLLVEGGGIGWVSPPSASVNVRLDPPARHS